MLKMKRAQSCSSLVCFFRSVGRKIGLKRLNQFDGGNFVANSQNTESIVNSWKNRQLVVKCCLASKLRYSGDKRENSQTKSGTVHQKWNCHFSSHIPKHRLRRLRRLWQFCVLNAFRMQRWRLCLEMQRRLESTTVKLNEIWNSKWKNNDF